MKRKSILFIPDWSNFDENVGSVLLKWIYSGVTEKKNLTIELMREASKFKLDELVGQCEKNLIGIVTLRDCVHLYTVAEELGTAALRDHCSSLISVHWVNKFRCYNR